MIVPGGACRSGALVLTARGNAAEHYLGILQAILLHQCKKRHSLSPARPFGWTSFYMGDNTGGVWENTHAVQAPWGGVSREWSEIRCAPQP